MKADMREVFRRFFFAHVGDLAENSQRSFAARTTIKREDVNMVLRGKKGVSVGMVARIVDADCESLSSAFAEMVKIAAELEVERRLARPAPTVATDSLASPDFAEASEGLDEAEAEDSQPVDGEGRRPRQ